MHLKEADNLIDLFQPGDLLFGLENEARDLFYSELKSKLTIMKAKHSYVTLDEIVKPIEPYYIYGDDLGMSPLRDADSPVKKHAQVLLASTGFTEIVNLPLSPCSKEHKKIMVSCFLAIEHYPGMIHFCLDGLNLNKVRGNSKLNKKLFNGYTSSELRYIARNYTEIEQKVIFYKNGRRVEAPWVLEGISPGTWLENYQEEEHQATPALENQMFAQRKLFFMDDAAEKHESVEETVEPNIKRARIEGKK